MAPGSGLSRRRPLRNPGRGSGTHLLRVRRQRLPYPGQRTSVRCGDSTACSRSCQAGIGGRIPAAPLRRAWRRVPSLSLPQRGRGLGAAPRGGRSEGAGESRLAPTGGGWIPAGVGMTGSGILGFDDPWWLRGGPSSQSSPGGRRGKTSRPHLCLSPAGGLRAQGKPQASWTLADPSQSPRPHPAPLPLGEGPEQKGRAPTRDAPTGGGWIPACAGMTGSGILGFDDPRWVARRPLISIFSRWEKRQDLPAPPMVEPRGRVARTR